MPEHEVFSVVARPLREPRPGPPVLLSDLLPVSSAPPPLSPFALVAHGSRMAKECPVCGGQKWSFGVFCERCRDALPRDKWHEHIPVNDDPEAYARWWQSACADLRGE